VGNLATESAPLTTDKVSESISPTRAIRYFYTVKKTGNRTSYKGQTEPPEGTHPIWFAVVREDWMTCKRCLDDDPSLIAVTGSVLVVGGINFYKDLPLIHVIATWSDSGRALRYLIALGANVNAYHRCGTPLHFAVRWSADIEAVRYLISEGANVNAKDNHGRTPLHLAAGRNPNVAVAKCLVEHGAIIRAKDNRGLTPLDVSFRYAKSDEVGLYFLELMTGSKGVRKS
jgi:hypothetical protein